MRMGDPMTGNDQCSSRESRLAAHESVDRAVAFTALQAGAGGLVTGAALSHLGAGSGYVAVFAAAAVGFVASYRFRPMEGDDAE